MAIAPSPMHFSLMRYLSVLLISPAVLLLNCSASSFSHVMERQSPPATASLVASANVWSGSFQGGDWLVRWGKQDKGSWGLQNMTVSKDETGQFSEILRVRYPAGSASPAVSRKTGAPLGGGQFYANLGMPPRDSLRLIYYVRFPKDFNFVKGGKLPGLFGGEGNSGGDIPNGKDGFSTRFMWRRNGDGEVYAYLPTSKTYGTSLGRGKWRFQPGVWHRIEQEVTLNQPKKKDGRVRVWFDGDQVFSKGGLTFRSVTSLKIDGIFFSTFFGGDDPSWATPKEVYVDFANFAVTSDS